ncbi:hypothetical protein HPB50_000021 [Hyalomma asiaticum]|uniref:Uncharacterized protein n=1 Tax=Hyalomma asiaticum TaxID=266040 RepID=A0ACB7RH17_HYAAI|nr:hypothetical protein HPB50_000021 [Hyalomma asiaticum]
MQCIPETAAATLQSNTARKLRTSCQVVWDVAKAKLSIGAQNTQQNPDDQWEALLTSRSPELQLRLVDGDPEVGRHILLCVEQGTCSHQGE